MGLMKYGGKINIVYSNGVRDRISPPLLTTLLEARQIASFKRSEGWVHVGVDPIRKPGNTNYGGSERRSSLHKSADVTSSHPVG